MIDKFDEMAERLFTKWRTGRESLNEVFAAELRAVAAAARAEERERCAKIADVMKLRNIKPHGVEHYRADVAAAIRAQGEQ